MLFSVIIVLAGIVLQVKGCHFGVKPLDFYHCFRELLAIYFCSLDVPNSSALKILCVDLIVPARMPSAAKLC